MRGERDRSDVEAVRALIVEARGFIAGSNPDSARTTLIRDLADALEFAIEGRPGEPLLGRRGF